MSGLDRKDRGVAGKYRDKQGSSFFESDFPEKNMWFAVIYRALEEIRPTGKRTGKVKLEKRKRKDNNMWFFVSPTSSLKWICDNFAIDIAVVRAEADRRYYKLPKEIEAETNLEKEDPYNDEM